LDFDEMKRAEPARRGEEGGTVHALVCDRLLAFAPFQEFRNGRRSRDSYQRAIEAEPPAAWGLNEDQLNLSTRFPVDVMAFVRSMVGQLFEDGMLPSARYPEAELARYCDQVAALFDHRHHFTYIFPEEAALLFAIAHIARPAQVLFLGSYYGYWAAWAMPGIQAAKGEAVLVDPQTDVLEQSRANLLQLGFEDVCTFVCGDAVHYLQSRRLQCDLIVLDAEGPAESGPVERRGKAIYHPIAAAATPLLRRGGLLVAHNILMTNLTDNSYFDRKIAMVEQQLERFFHHIKLHYDRSRTFPTTEGVGVYRRGGHSSSGSTSN
jgi:predicted O-methyltransferase YrrM